ASRMRFSVVDTSALLEFIGSLGAPWRGDPYTTLMTGRGRSLQHAGKVLPHRFLLGRLWDELTGAPAIRAVRDRDRLSAAAGGLRLPYLVRSQSSMLGA